MSRTNTVIEPAVAPHRGRLALCAAGIAALALTTAAPAAAARDEVRAAAAADMPASTGAGTSYVVPKGWRMSGGANVKRLVPAEPGNRVLIVEAGRAATPEAAVEAAWRRAGEAVPGKIGMIHPSFGSGWQKRWNIEYESLTGGNRAILAVAQRHGDLWTVIIAEGDKAVLQKRQAAIGQVRDSLRPAGYKPESFVGRPARPLDAARIEALKQFVSQSMRQLDIPGVGLAVIDRGKVVFAGGLGVKDVESQAPVDADTLFMIASNTKGMATLLLAQAVDTGKLDWNSNAHAVYPAFRLADIELTRKIRIRDLVCACTGLPRHDFEQIFNVDRDTPPESVFDMLAENVPTSGLGEVYQYNNLMATAGGYIAGKAFYPDLDVRTAFDRGMQTRIFDPLGMNDTTLDMDRAIAGNHATPYGFDETGRVTRVAMDFNYMVVPFHPGGSVWSSANDMSKYVLNELNLGRLPDGSRIVSQENLLVRRRPGISMGNDSYYGMGLMTKNIGGIPVIHHGGSMAGYKSDWFALPDTGIGAVILTNSDSGVALLAPFGRRLLELVYDGRPEAEQQVAAAAAQIEVQQKIDRETLRVPPEPELVAMLAKRYENPAVGHIDVTRDGDDLIFDFGLWRSRMGSRRMPDGSAMFVTLDPADSSYPFAIYTREGRTTLVLKDQQHEYVYDPVAGGRR